MEAGPIVAWAALAFSIIVGFIGLLRYFNTEIAQERRWREEADALLHERVSKTAQTDLDRYSMVVREFGAYKLEALEKFATAGAIEKSEERLALAIDRMTARLEQVVGRIETLSVEMARVSKAKVPS